MTRTPTSRVPGAGFPALGEAQLRLLRTFAAVVDAGGLQPAAAALQLDLSTVSRQFAELEGWLGVRLARRGRSGFALTTEGTRLIEHTRHLFGALRAFGDEAAALAGRSRPLLRLGIVDALLTAGAALPAALARCFDALPGLQLRVATLPPLEIERALLAGALDAGIVAARAPASGLEQHRLFGESSSLYVAPGHPWYAEPGRALDGDAPIVTDPYADERPAAGARAPTAGAHADSIEAVALLVCSGRYAGFLPDHLVQGTPALQALRAVLPERLAYRQDIVLTCRQGKATPAVRALLRALVD